MKIVLVNDNHGKTGGAEKYVFDLRQRLQQIPGLSLFSIEFGLKKAQDAHSLVLKAAQSNLAKLFWRIIPHPIVYWRLRKQLKQIQPDVIHLHNVKQFSMSVLWALRPYRVVQTVHDYGSICPLSFNLHQDQTPCPTGLRLRCFWQHRLKYSRLSYAVLAFTHFMLGPQIRKTVDTFLVPSPQLIHYLQLNHFSPAVLMLPFQTLPQAASFTQVKPAHFLFAGKLAPQKGVELLLEEFALAHAINPSLFLTISGLGPSEAKLRERVLQLHLQNHVQFVGWQDDLTKFYEESAAVIFPSIGAEGFGLVITEAMGHARAVIGANRSSLPGLIDNGETGLLFDPLRTGDLAEKLLQIANDNRLGETLGKNGRQKVEKLIDNQVLMQKMLAVYKGEIA